MFKKVLAISLVFCLMVLSFAGCKKDDKKNTPTTTPKTSSTSTKSTALTGSATSSGTNTQSPAPTSDVSTGSVSEYSIDIDFQIKNFAAGIVFGYIDSSNFLMWQINTNEYGKDLTQEIPEAERKVFFRPHIWSAGAISVISEIDISNTIKWEDKNKKHHMKITVSAANEINTYIDDILIDTYTDEMAAYGLFGFRQTAGVYEDQAYFDNILIKNTASKQVLKQFDFNTSVNPFAEGEIVNGVMGDSAALYMNQLTEDVCVLE